jgi:hypothetical protein
MVGGGPIQEIGFGGRSFAVAQDSDPPRDLGGFMIDIEMNGDGTGRAISEHKPWKFGPVAIQIDDDNGDQAFIQDIVNRKEPVSFDVTFADGSIYYGQGIATGELEKSSKSATMEVTFKGPGTLTKQ